MRSVRLPETNKTAVPNVALVSTMCNMTKQTLATKLQQLHADTYPGQPIRDAALQSKISYRTLGGLMNGTGNKPTFATLTKLANYYGVTVDYLLNDTTEPEPVPLNVIDDILRLAEELAYKCQQLEQQLGTNTPPPEDWAAQTRMK